MKVVVLILASVSIVLCWSPQQDNHLKWVDYGGNNIPANAVAAGTNKNNETVYVARAFYDKKDPQLLNTTSGWIPTGLVEGQESVDILLFGEILTVKTSIQILTTVNDSMVEWVHADSITFTKLFETESVHPVCSGQEKDGLEFISYLYIGRIESNGEVLIGKIFTTAVLYADNLVIYAVDDSTGTINVRRAKKYHALIYHL